MIQNFIIFVTIIFSLNLLAWALMPLLRARRAGAAGAMDELVREQASSLLTSLDSLYQSKEEDQVSQEDFVNIERRLILELAKIYHRQGLNPEALDSDNSDEDLICPSCGAGIKADYQFCPECGAGLKVAS